MRIGRALRAAISPATMLVSGTSAVGISQRPSVVWNSVVGELWQLVGAVGGGVVDQRRDGPSPVAVLARVQVEHELPERAFQPGERAAQDDEAGAGDFGGGCRNPSGRAPRRARNAALARSRARAARRLGRATTLAVSSAPSGTSASRMLGRVSSTARISASSAAALPSRPAISSRSAVASASRAAVSAPARLPWPICSGERVAARLLLLQGGLRRAALGVAGEQLGRDGRQAAAGHARRRRRRDRRGSVRMSCIDSDPIGRWASARPCARRWIEIS